MRVIWLVLAGCGGAGTAGPAAAPPPAQAVAAPTATRAARPTHVRARVGVDKGAWTDIAIDGTDEAAHGYCNRLVARELMQAAPRKLRVMRDCAVEPLPPPPRSTVQLVAMEHLTHEDILLGDILTGHREPLLSGPASATVVRVLPLADRYACEAMIVQLDAADQRSWMETQQATARFLDEQLKRAIESETEACTHARVELQSCAKLRADLQPECQLIADSKRRLCDQEKSQREIVEARRAKPDPRPITPRTCRVP